MTNASNFAFHAPALEASQDDTSVVNSRYRTWFNIHDGAECQYGVYLQAEIGHVLLGDGFEFPKTFGTNGDSVGVELRRGFLWFKPTENSLIRAGILAWEDRFGERPSFTDPLWAVDRYDSSQSPLANSVWDFNVGGLVFEANPGEVWHYSLASLILRQGDETIGGDGSSLLFTADVDRDVGSALWGGSVYYLRDRGGYSYGGFGGPFTDDESWDMWIGGRGHFGIGLVDSSVFMIANTGEVAGGSWQHTGWAAKWASSMTFDRGTLLGQVMYSTGNDETDPRRSGEFRTVAQSVRDNFGAQSYWSLLGLTSPRGPSDVNDLGIGLQNRGLGLVTVQAGWQQPVTDTWSTYVGAGWLRSEEQNPQSLATAIGTEILGEVRWQMADTLTLDAGGSWLFTGDFYKTSRTAPAPDDLYQLYARWQLEF